MAAGRCWLRRCALMVLAVSAVGTADESEEAGRKIEPCGPELPAKFNAAYAAWQV